ncbi:MAG: GHKL domain-containing protein [bacterium]|nr:GHKL domain-containing protein [bacterium]
MFNFFNTNHPKFKFLIYFIAIFGILVSFITSWLVAENEKYKHQLKFENESEIIFESLQHTLEDVIFDIDSIARFFINSDNVTRNEFNNFTTPLIARKKEIQALEWAPVVKNSERLKYELNARKDGLKNFHFVEKIDGSMKIASKRPIYYPVYYLQPYKGNESAVGYDLGSNPTRLKAIVESFKSGYPIATARIKLVQETEKQYGFLVFYPVYRKNKSLITEMERRENFRGFVLGVFRVGDLVNSVLIRHNKKHFMIKLIDLSAAKGNQILFNNFDNNLNMTFYVNRSFQFAGRKWFMTSGFDSKTYFSTQMYKISWIVFIFGIIITMLLILLFIFFKKGAEVKLIKTELFLKSSESDLDKRTFELGERVKELNYLYTISELIQKREIPLADRFQKIVDLIPVAWQYPSITCGRLNIESDEYKTSNFKKTCWKLCSDIKLKGVKIGVFEVYYLEERPDIDEGPFLKEERNLIETSTKILSSFIERVDVEKKLLAQSNELERSNKELENFAYVASHDLKAPLRAIDNLTQWIEEDIKDIDKSETKEYMQLLRNRVNRMENLLNSLLTYSRVGRMKSEYSEVDLNILIKEIISLINPPSYIVFKIEKTLPVFFSLRLPLQQVFINLIGNAVKHCDNKNLYIRISFEEENVFYRFTISDNGPGISSEFHKKMFKLFQTLKSRDEVEGSGMGLAIVKKTIENYGGIITLNSEIGLGSSFSFTWPKNIDL